MRESRTDKYIYEVETFRESYSFEQNKYYHYVHLI